MRDFVSTQVKQSQLSIEGLKDDMRYQASMTQSQLGALKELSAKNSLDISQSAQKVGKGPQQPRSNEDIQTQTLK